MTHIDELEESLKRPGIADAIGQFAVSAIQSNIAAGQFAPNAAVTSNVKKGSPPLSDRGGLVSSITYKVDGEVVKVGTNHPGAAVNNYGGEIKAKRSWLLIPASSRMRSLQRKYGWSPKEVCDGLRADGYSVWRQGRALFYRKKGKGSSKKKAVMIFILKKSVRIPKREFMKLTETEIDALFDIIRGKR